MNENTPVTIESTTDQAASTLYDSDDRPHHIVAVGASAGGLEALQDFFDHIPGDTGAAYVVIQHLSPDFESVMDQLLRKHSTMPVNIVTSNTQMRVNQIYLLAPKKNMVTQEGKLILSDRQSQARRLDLPINDFFRSLATDLQNRAVGIILSGTGSDGSLGIKSVHEVGGLVMVQNPEEAQFDGMPRNAISTGVVDMVAPVAELAEQLVAFFKRPLVAINSTEFREHLAKHQNSLQHIFDLLDQQTGVDFSHYKPSTVARRLEHRMSISNVSELPEYLEIIRSPRGQKEIDALKHDLLIIVTEFFRDSDAFENLAQKAVRRLLLTKPEKETIRIWVLGCATGEEAYSIGMVFFEEMQHLNLDRDFKIFATDINQNATTFAAAGTYPPTITNELSEKRLASFFHRHEDGSYTIHKFLRDRVIFAVHNILKDPPFSNIDLVSCRNLLIYFQPHGQRKAFSLMNFSLNNSGLMFLGGAETPTGMEDSYRAIDYKSRLYEKIGEVPRYNKGFSAPQRDRQEASSPSTRLMPISQAIGAGFTEERSSALYAAIDYLFDQYLPPTIIINQKMEVIYSYGKLDRYLQSFKPGRMYTQLHDLLKPSVSSYVSSAISKVIDTNKVVVYEDVSISDSDEENIDTLTDIRVIPYKPRVKSDTNAFIISLDSSNRHVKTDRQADAVRFKPDEAVENRLSDLEEELENTRLDLRLAHQELGSVREELQSANEELMASNEELQGTNEELQSVNEELYTVNSEYQEKITELSIANDDLDNFLKSTGVAALFLDKENRIRRYTPEFVNYVNILPVDIHRPFLDLSLPFDAINISEHLQDVLLGNKSYHQDEINMNDGRYVVLRLFPYTNANHMTDGVVLVIDDITSYRNAINNLVQRERESQKLYRMNQVGSWSMNKDVAKIQMSDALLTMLNLRSGEHLHNREEFSQMIHHEDRDRVSEYFTRMFTGDGELATNFRIISARDEELLIHCDGILYNTSSDQPHCLYGIMQNITVNERLMFDDNINDLEFYSLLEDKLPGIFLLDLSSRIITCNSVLSDMVGYSISDLQGMDFLQIVHDDDKQVSKENILTCREMIRPACLYETRLVTRSHSFRWVEVMASAVEDAASPGKSLFFGTVTDINDLKSSYEDMQVNTTARLARIFLANQQTPG